MFTSFGTKTPRKLTSSTRFGLLTTVGLAVVVVDVDVEPGLTGVDFEFVSGLLFAVARR